MKSKRIASLLLVALSSFSASLSAKGNIKSKLRGGIVTQKFSSKIKLSSKKSFDSKSVGNFSKNKNIVSLSSNSADGNADSKMFLGKKRNRNERKNSKSLIPGVSNKVTYGVGGSAVGAAVLIPPWIILNKKFHITEGINNWRKVKKAINFIKERFQFNVYHYYNSNYPNWDCNYGFWECDLDDNKTLCVYHCRASGPVGQCMTYFDGSFVIDRKDKGDLELYMSKINDAVVAKLPSRIGNGVFSQGCTGLNLCGEKNYNGYHAELPSSNNGHRLVEGFVSGIINACFDSVLIKNDLNNEETKKTIKEAVFSAILNKFNKVMKKETVRVLNIQLKVTPPQVDE